MLDVTVKSHREFLLAGTPAQKLFVALTLRPDAEVCQARPPLAVAFVVDTSGSMREVVAANPGPGAGQSKMELVVSALQTIFESAWLADKDRVGLVKFDDTAEALLNMTGAGSKARLLAAAERLVHYSGGTQMGEGLRQAGMMLAPETCSRRIVLLTDGQAMDEELVDQTAHELATANIPVTAIGFGHDWNADLLTRLTDRTQGRPVHVVPDSENPMPPSIRASELPGVFLSEMQKAGSEVVTGITLKVRTTKDAKLDRVTRVQPGQSEVDITSERWALGNAGNTEPTVFVFEMSLGRMAAGRFRVAQVGLTYEVPGKGFRGEAPPVDVVVEFTNDEAAAARIDSDVMQYVQVRNIEGLVVRAQQEALIDPAQAGKTLELARSLTQRLGNQTMTRNLENAMTELRSSKTISPGTSKTLRIGSKTQVLKQEQAGICLLYTSPSPRD